MRKKISIAFFIVIFIFQGIIVQKVNADFDCLQLTSTSTPDQKSICQNELTQLLKDEADLEAKLLDQSKQSGTLKGDINVLTAQINALKAKIKARGLVIAQLKVNIAEKVSTIQTLSNKLDSENESLAQLLRNTNEFDQQNIVNLILTDNSISDFYSDLESYSSIKEAVKASTDKIKGIKSDTEVAKKDLEKKQNAETDAQIQLQNAQKQVVQTENDKKQLLAISKDKEATYAKLAADKKIRADKIRAALFQLRDTKSIPFGAALEYAQEAQAKTGVSPAFLLAIITQESNLGTDTGSCYVTDFNTGAGVSTKGKSFSKVMHPTRDIPPFTDITKSLGLDPYKTLVSCPIGGSGYGGAMGPAQFIASTWVGIESKLSSALGISNPDPWAPKDALMASAIFLSDLGASGDSYTSQMRAACKYYGTGGSTCAYGRNVMSRVTKIQSNIDLLSQ